MTDVIGEIRDLARLPRIEITVHGVPAPQGSKSIGRAGGKVTGRPILVESSKAVKPWRKAVDEAARDALKATGIGPLHGALHVSIDFYFTRPKGHYGTGKNLGRLKVSAPAYPAVMPDLSKLIRSTEDALTGAGIWHDDAQVVAVVARKHYCTPFGLVTPGAAIRIEQLTQKVELLWRSGTSRSGTARSSARSPETAQTG